MQSDTPIFRSVNQALHVSYLMAVLPPTTKSPTQSVIDDLMDQAGVLREVTKDGTINFAGLSPLEVRAQCAMIIGAVQDHCIKQERMAIEAWFAHDARKADGVRFLCNWCAPLWTVESPQARMLITWRVNVTDDSAAAKHCSIRDITGEHGIPKSTVHDQMGKIIKAARGLRRSGMSRLEGLFIKHGVIDDPAMV